MSTFQPEKQTGSATVWWKLHREAPDSPMDGYLTQIINHRRHWKESQDQQRGMTGWKRKKEFLSFKTQWRGGGKSPHTYLIPSVLRTVQIRDLFEITPPPTRLFKEALLVFICSFFTKKTQCVRCTIRDSSLLHSWPDKPQWRLSRNNRGRRMILPYADIMQLLCTHDLLLNLLSLPFSKMHMKIK